MFLKLDSPGMQKSLWKFLKLPCAFYRSHMGLKRSEWVNCYFCFGRHFLESRWRHSPLITPRWLLVWGRWGRHSSDVYNRRRGTVPCRWTRRSGRTAAWVAGAEPIRPAFVLEDRAVMIIKKNYFTSNIEIDWSWSVTTSSCSYMVAYYLMPKGT